MKKIISILLTLVSINLWAADFTISSPTLKDGGTLPNKHVFNSFGCTGENISPAIKWANAPAGTKSFALTIYDPDAPTGSGWWHWTLVNIPANVTELKEGASSKALPKGSVEGRTDFGKPGFGGACPPPGDKPHRYIITVYALSTDKLDVNAEASGALVGYNINFATLAKASLTATFGRPAKK